MTDETLNAIIEAGKKATPRPWHWATSNSTRRLSTERRDGEVAFGQIHRLDKTADIAIDDRDMRYSELACNHADALAAENVRLRELLRRAADSLEVEGRDDLAREIYMELTK